MANKRAKPRVIFEETPEIVEKLKACAESKGLSVSDVIRIAIREFFDHREKEARNA